jgi:isoquinoline 1-oxidoreductase subunit beta
MTEDKKSLSRRKFLKRGAIVLGGTMVASYLGCNSTRRFIAQKVENMDLPANISSFNPDFWFQILPDNNILLKSPKVEMGQGIFTGYAMMAAEELNVPLEQMRVEHANTATGIEDELGTGGSNSTSGLFKPIREMAAVLREMLKLSAATIWKVPVNQVITQNGILQCGDKKMTFFECVVATKSWVVPKTPALKPSSEFKYIGKDVKRIDLKDKVMGTAKYTIDTHFPNMVYATMLPCPYFNAKLKSVKTAATEQSPDVLKVVQQNGWCAVVAKTQYAALSAAQKLEATWDVPKLWQQAEMEAMVTVGKGKEVNVQKVGNALSVLESGAGQVYQQAFRTPFGTHAPMEVNGTVANVTKDTAIIVVGTQHTVPAKALVAKALGLDKKMVDIQMPYLGGGFGRKGRMGNVVETAILSKIMGRPVKMMFTREQEFQNSFYRPLTHHVLKAKIGEKGDIQAITHDQASPDMILKHIMGNSLPLKLLGADFISSGHGASLLYNIPNKSATLWNTDVPVPVGIWRGVGMYPNTFATESFMNELAHQTKKDAIDFRIGLLTDPKDEIAQRAKKVLEVLKEKSGWTTAKPEGIGRGVSIANDRKSIAGSVVEVAIVEGKIKVQRVTQVLDVGMILNPEGIRAQMEGCVMMGISGALYEEVKIKDSQISVSNFHELPLANLMDVPDIQTVILANAHEPYGVGEPPLAPIAPAIAGAILDLTGKMLRNLPLKIENT